MSIEEDSPIHDRPQYQVQDDHSSLHYAIPEEDVPERGYHPPYLCINTLGFAQGNEGSTEDSFPATPLTKSKSRPTSDESVNEEGFVPNEHRKSSFRVKHEPRQTTHGVPVMQPDDALTTFKQHHRHVTYEETPANTPVHNDLSSSFLPVDDAFMEEFVDFGGCGASGDFLGYPG